MFKRVLPLFILLLLSFIGTVLAETKYTEADLTALLKEQNFLQVLLYADKVKPSERTPKWKELVIKSVVGRINQLKKENSSKDAWNLSEDALHTYPWISTNKEFKTARVIVACSAAKEIRKERHWYSNVQKIIDRVRATDKSDEALYYIATNDDYKVETIDLLTLCEKSPKKYAKDPKVHKYLISWLTEPAKQKTAIRIRAFASKYSAKYLKNQLQKNIFERRGSIPENSYLILKDSKLLTNKDAINYHLFVFMYGSSMSGEVKFKEAMKFLSKQKKSKIRDNVKLVLAEKKLPFAALDKKEFAREAAVLLKGNLSPLLKEIHAECTKKRSRFRERPCDKLFEWVGRLYE